MTTKRRLVFCRVRQDVNKNRLYVHEVFLEDEIKSNALQTAAPANESQKPHGGIALYRSILQSVYAVNPANVSKAVDENGEPLVFHDKGQMISQDKNDWGRMWSVPSLPEDAKRYVAKVFKEISGSP